MGDFVYKKDTHEYFWQSRPRPGVTDIIKANGMMTGAAFFTDEGRDKGTAVHRACELLLWDNLDPASVDERIKGYVESCRKFVEHTKLKPKRTEFSAYHPELGFAGTWDFDDGDLLGDFKSGAVERWHGVQSSAYCELARVNNIKIKRRGGLYLQADGSIAKYREHVDRSDWKVFLSALNLVKWKESS